jgi:uncharacterized protein YggE
MKKQSLFARASTLIGALALVLTLSPTAQAQSQTGTAAIGTASGITVFGYGDASAPADLAHVTLTFPSTNASYGPTGPVFEPVDEEEVSQIVEVLVANGVTSDTLNVNIFGRSGYYGPGPAMTIDFPYAEPANLNNFLATLQTALDDERAQTIQQVTAVFLVEDCTALEAQAWEQALSTAQDRATAAAGLMQVTLGELTSIAEVSVASPYGQSISGCSKLEAATHALDIGSFLNNSQNSADTVEVSINLQATYAITR